MKQLLLLSFFFSTSLLALAQRDEQIIGSGNTIQFTQKVEAFTTIELRKMNVQVVVETGAATYSVEVRIDDNLQQYLKISNEGSVLKLSMDPDYKRTGKWLSSNTTVITIKAPKVENLINNGNTNIDILLSKQAAFHFTSNGNPDVLMKGEVKDFMLTTTGNSDIDASELVCETVTVSSNGNADIVLNAKEVVEKKMSGNYSLNNIQNKPARKRW